MSKKIYKDYESMSENLFHNPDDVLNKTYENKVQELVSDKLLDKVCSYLKLDESRRKLLSDTLLKSYTAYYVSLQKLEDSVPFQEQRKVLKKVCNNAGKLLDALNELGNIPQANQKFFKEFMRSKTEHHGFSRG